MPTDTNIEWDDVFGALSDETRRTVLDHLGRTDSMTLSELVRACVPDDEPPSEAELNEVTALLFHTHLPKLAVAKLITWDAREDEITPTSLTADLVDGSLDVPLSETSTRSTRPTTVE
jgi:DNA-binding transcriptional ArsR family regulator